jgi:uncharacterized FlaG/YvyC family protein
LENADDNETEPIVVSGLGKLTAAQQALAEFLELDPDLLAGAAMGNPYNPEEFPKQETDKWISEIPRDEVETILKQLLEGKGQLAERFIKKKYAAYQRSIKEDKLHIPRRTIGELKENFEKARNLRKEREKREQRQLEMKRKKEHKAYLKNYSEDFEKIWKSAGEQAELGTGKGYDKACLILTDIAEAYALFSTREQFLKELKEFMVGHMRRKALIQRLVKAGIWEDK